MLQRDFSCDCTAPSCRHHSSTTLVFQLLCISTMHQKSKVEIWTSPRHDPMNFDHDQIRPGHAHQPFSVLCHSLSSFSTSLRASSTATRATLAASTGFTIGWKRVEPAWRHLGNSFNERLRQRRSSTILGYGHCLHQFHPV